MPVNEMSRPAEIQINNSAQYEEVKGEERLPNDQDYVRLYGFQNVNPYINC